MLYVKDLPRMAAFYAVLLGCEPVKLNDQWAEFKLSSGAILGLHAIPASIAETIVITDPPAIREETPIKLVFETADAAAEAARLEQQGVILIQRPWGSWDGLDPEGNVFGLAETV